MASATTLRSALLGMVALAAAILAFVFFGHGGDSAKQLSGFEGPPFKLAATTGEMLDSATLKGKPYGVFFGFTHCPEVCPTTLYEMTGALKDLGDVPQAKDFRLFFIAVDPEQDTVAAMKDYLSNFDPRIVGLIPTLQELPPTAKSFHVFYKKVPTSDGYTMDHTATVFLFGPDNKLKATISYGEDHDTRVAKLKRLLSGN